MLLALMRGLFVAGALSSFGASLFTKFILLPVAGEFGAEPSKMVSRRLRAIMAGSLGVALLAGIAWLVLQTQAMAETQSFAETSAAVPAVLFGTRFGQVLCLQAAALAGAAASVAARSGPARLAAPCSPGLAVLLEAGHSHAFAMAHGLSLLLLAQALHLLRRVRGSADSCRSWVVAMRRSRWRGEALLARGTRLSACRTAILQGIELSGGQRFSARPMARCC